MYIPTDYDKVQYLEAGLEGLRWSDSEKGVPTELLRHSPRRINPHRTTCGYVDAWAKIGGVSTLDETVDQAPSMWSSKWLEQA
jgi:hypothetical protein